MTKRDIINEIDKIRRITNQGIKAQLMRGDRTSIQCWSAAIKGLERLDDALINFEGKVIETELLYNVDFE